MKFSGKVGRWANEKMINFCGDPDTDTGPDPDPYRYAGKTCVGGGMHCLSASSLFVCLFVCLSVSNVAQKLPNAFA